MLILLVLPILSMFSILSAWAETTPAIPIHSLDSCEDERYPIATDDWILGCSKKGIVDSIWFFDSKEAISLPGADGWMKGSDFFQVGREGGFWNTDTKDFSGARIFVSPEEAAGRVTATYVAVSAPNSIFLLEREQGKIYQTEAKPMGYQLPAILDEQVAWIEWNGDKQEILLWNWKTQSKIIVSAYEPLNIEAEGNILIWSEPNWLQIFNAETGEKTAIEAKIRGNMSIRDGRICWGGWREEKSETDIICSDGFQLDREGNQFSPIQLEKGIIFQEEQGVMWLSY